MRIPEGKSIKRVVFILFALLLFSFPQEFTNMRNELFSYIGTKLIYSSGDMRGVE